MTTTMGTGVIEFEPNSIFWIFFSALILSSILQNPFRYILGM